jgi:TolB-like protein
VVSPWDGLHFLSPLVLRCLDAYARSGTRNLIYHFEDYVLDTDRRELRREGSLLSVEPKVFDLLVHLIGNRERVVSKDDLIGAVWNGRIVSESTLASCINAARNAIGDSGEEQRFIKTLPRKGIRFVGAVREEKGHSDIVLPHSLVEATRPALTLPDKPSIAVLPFTDMTGDPQHEYFSDGITEDIITALSRLRWFFVIARNSTFIYKGQAADVRQVGRDLGVRYVLEGSVRKSGQRVRITSQLLDAMTGNHIWSDRYDRERPSGRDHSERRGSHRAETACGRGIACRNPIDRRSGRVESRRTRPVPLLEIDRWGECGSDHYPAQCGAEPSELCPRA